MAKICVVLAMLATAGCAQTEATDIGSVPVGEITEIPGGVDWGSPAEVRALAASSPTTSMTSAAGVVLVGGPNGVYRVGTAALEPVSVYSEEGEPVSVGAVVAMAARADGAFVVSEAGVFHTYSNRLLLSPLSDAVAGLDVRAMAVAGADSDEVVWIAATDGLHRLSATVWDRLDLGDPGVPTAVGASTTRVLAAYGPALYELDPADLTYLTVPPTLGNIVSIAADGDRFWLGSDAGVTVRQADGRYTRYSLDGESVSAVAPGGFALTGGGVVRITDAGPLGLASTSSGVGLAVDRWGNVWTGGESEVSGALVGESTSFAEVVAPALESRCGLCHTDGSLAPRHDFTNYETVVALGNAVLERVTTGQMPPQGLPALSEEELEGLISWFATGQQP